MHKKGRSRWNQGLLSAQRRMASVSGRCILLSAVVVLLTALPASAGPNLSYLYREIAEHTGAGGFSWPAINSSGQAAFLKVEVSGLKTIYKGHVGSLEKVVDNTGTFPNLSIPTLNDLGDVAFCVNDEDDTEVLRYTAATQGFTSIAKGDASDSKAVFNDVRGASINNSGAVAFRGRKGSNENRQDYIAVGTGGAPAFIDAIDAQYAYTGTPQINVSSPTPEVAWMMFGTQAESASRIIKGNEFSQTTIADTASEQFDSLLSAPSMSNSGDVSFIGIKNGVFGKGVYRGNDSTPALVADTNGEYDDFYETSVSAAGVIVDAKIDFGGWGIYKGSAPSTGKVLATGDTVPGYPSVVETIFISKQAINDNGQIAMVVGFADGAGRILRADPFDLQQLYETANTVTVFKAEGTSSLSQPISQQMSGSNGGEDLSFDYYFPGSTGQLAVTLGGELLAEIDAPAVLANGFTTFQMPVDIGQLFPDPVDQLLLQFSLSGVGETGILFLDNIEFGSLVNGDFGTGNLAGWESTFFNDDSVGVAINPFYNAAAAVPEPAALLLALLGLALLGLALLPRRRRR